MTANSLLKTIQEKYREGLLALAEILWSTAFSTIPNSTWEKLSAYIPTKSLWAVTGGLLILVFALWTYIYDLRKKLNNELKLQFGVYWNNENQPHCLKCKTPLIQPAKVPLENLVTIPGLTPMPKQYCIKCNLPFAIVKPDRTELTLAEAMALRK